MKNRKSIFVSALLALVLLAGCADFGDINKDPNKPSTAFTGYLFTYACRYIPYFSLGDATNGYDPFQLEWSGYISESKNNQYGPLATTAQFSRGNAIYLYALKNLNMIIEMNEDPEQKDLPNVASFGSTANQIAAARTLMGYYYMSLTDILGPIVLSEAFKGASEGIWQPKYDTQKEVYTQLDEILKSAYSQFDTGSSLSANDVVFGGNISKWKKLNASIRMMLAIKLCDVDPATGKTRFAAAWNDGGMTSPADDFNYTYDDKYWNRLYYWVSPDYSGAGFNAVPNMFIVEQMKALKDNRMFKFFDIEGYKGVRDEAKFPRDSYDSFYGIPFGLINNNAVADWNSCCCSITSSLLGMQATVPIIPAARVLLTEAEAAWRGWISADAKALYEAGIRASFAQWGATGVDEYLASEAVAYVGGNGQDALEQIAIQRWIATYMADGVEAWSDWRRLDIPYLPVGPGAVDSGNEHYPYRLGYYTDTDVAYNYENYVIALQDLSGGKDDVSNRVWWDVKDNRKGVLTTEQCTPPAL